MAMHWQLQRLNWHGMAVAYLLGLPVLKGKKGNRLSK